MIAEFTAQRMTELLPMRQAIHLMREAFQALSSGAAVCPMRLNLPIAEQDASSLIMPCHLPGRGYFGIKTANVFPRNRGRDLPVINSVYHLYSAETGRPLATMDGTFLTKLRTGAACGLASDLLASPDSAILAVFGTGAQAESQIEAVGTIRAIREVLVFSRETATAEAFAGRMRSSCRASIRPASHPSDLQQADIICTATTSTEALFRSSDVKPGAHLNAIGAYRPDMCEVPADLIATCRLIVDQREAALEEAGDILQAQHAGLIDEDHLLTELGELLAGGSALRTPAGKVTVFKSVGSAVQDLVCAIHLYEQSALTTCHSGQVRKRKTDLDGTVFT